MSITGELLESLLFMSEGESLDFKRDAYALGDDAQKSEFIKDVLAFANAWRTSDAYIVIGATERPGERAALIGVSSHLRDADMQQLVNSKTNKPLRFHCIAFTFEGLALDIVHVPAGQHRPFYLKKPFGRLKEDVVYVRRGSSTDTARPDEISRMGALADAGRPGNPDLQLLLGDAANRETWEEPYRVVTALLPEHLPQPRRPAPPRETAFERGQREVLGRFAPISSLVDQVAPRHTAAFRPDEPTPTDLHKYRRAMARLARIGLVLRNAGDAVARDARAILVLPRSSGWKLIDDDDVPERPQGIMGTIARYSLRPELLGRRPARLTLHALPDRWEVDVSFGKVQSKAEIWCEDSLWLEAEQSAEIPVAARIFDDALPNPVEASFNVQIEVVDRTTDWEGDDAADPSFARDP